nr:MAG TPA: tail protein [Caudoviricetes sp.]
MYNQRSLRFEFTNETSSFDEKGNNTISISEVRSTVSFQSAGNLFGTQVNVSLFGLSMELLASLSSKAMGLFGSDTERISMKIYVGDTAIFVGYMTSSIANMNTSPNSALMIAATANADLQNKPSPPFSFNGATPVTSVITAICKAAGYSPYITGLDGIVATNPHYEGSIFNQLEKLCDDFEIAMSVASPTITFWPQNEKKDDVMPLISPEYGLIGYPIFSNGGVMFQTQFSTLLTTGRNVKLITSLPHASGTYKLTSVSHELSSWMPDGPWHSVCIANRILNEVDNGG